MRAMMANFSRSYLVDELPEWLHDLNERDDSTHTGRLVGICAMLVSANISVYIGLHILKLATA